MVTWASDHWTLPIKLPWLLNIPMQTYWGQYVDNLFNIELSVKSFFFFTYLRIVLGSAYLAYIVNSEKKILFI